MMTESLHHTIYETNIAPKSRTTLAMKLTSPLYGGDGVST
jgi:hypothetical protein